jgi:hypothetical protein
MARASENQFSGLVTVFHEERLPEAATPAGYAALIDAYRLEVPVPSTLSAIGTRHRRIEEQGWRIFGPRYAPKATFEGHLTFALKHEGLDLAVLKRLFLSVGAAEIEALVQAGPIGRYARRIWFLYEWLTGERLNLPDAAAGAYVAALDPELQWGVPAVNSRRHRIKNNLPGTPEFCPLVFRTAKLEAFVAANLAERARAVVAEVPRDLLARAAAFLLLKDSKSSYVIEGEHPPHDRIQRWGRAIGEAGRRPLDLDELLRLQAIVIGNARFVRLGLRQEGGFVGEHDRETSMPLPDHISARPDDLPILINGMSQFDRTAAEHLDPVIAAAALAFGFVFVHPFEDGNGRIHRYLIHHVLGRRGFNPSGLVFPVSSAILNSIDEYRRVLEAYSARVLPIVQWEPTAKGNVNVLNDTGDFYRFFDATPQAEFLFECVIKTIEEELPAETQYLRRYDEFRAGVEAIVDMPERTIELLFRMLKQNDGRLSQRARRGEFQQFTNEEVQSVEALYNRAFVVDAAPQ